MKRLLRISAISLAFVVGLALLWTIVTALWLKGSLPVISGRMSVDGLADKVRIVRDRDGVPHIYASSRDDALFGLGFVHGQDRLWQMEFQRRTVQGRLSEIAGSSTFIADLYLRTLGLYRAAESSARSLSPEARKAFESYAAGVNAARPASGKPLPPEFFMLGIRPESWSPTDSVAVLKGIAVQLSANAFQELFRAQLLRTLPEAKAAAFGPPLPPEVVKAYQQFAPKDPTKYAQALRALQVAGSVMEPTGASNNWVVGGARTGSGRPMLANDPHLPLTVPAFWYLAHLSWPGGSAIGGTVPGVPGIIAGRTNHLAWGLTTTGADTQDLYWEKIDPEDPGRYLTRNSSQRFGVRFEKIRIRFAPTRTIRILSTRHGPVLPTDEPHLKALVPDGYALSLRWPALDGEDRTGETALRMLDAPNAERATIERIFEPYRAPIQSFVYAGSDGNVGLILPGTIPVRKADNPLQGLLPGNGRDNRFDWQGVIPAAERPLWTGNSADTFITANNNVVPPGYRHMIALDFDTEHRARRIKTLLDARTQLHTIGSFRDVQLDDGEQFAMDVLPLMLSQTRPAGEGANRAHSMLEAWDRHMSPDRPEPLLFAAWMKSFTRALFADEMGEDFQRLWNDRPDFVTAVLRREHAAASFCDDVSTRKARETCPEILSLSLTAAVRELQDSWGLDMNRWRWSDAHKAVFSHTPFGFLPGLKQVFGLAAPIGGGNATIQRAAYRYGGALPYAAVHGAGYRGIYDMGSTDTSLYMISTGQSGNIFSPFYGNLTAAWARGEYLTMTTDEKAISRKALATLQLQPAGEISR